MINIFNLPPEQKPKKDVLFATVSSVSADGITLKFDGDSTPTIKKYKYNKSVSFQTGQRVKVCRVGSTFLVEYPI